MNRTEKAATRPGTELLSWLSEQSGHHYRFRRVDRRIALERRFLGRGYWRRMLVSQDLLDKLAEIAGWSEREDSQ